MWEQDTSILCVTLRRTIPTAIGPQRCGCLAHPYGLLLPEADDLPTISPVSGDDGHVLRRHRRQGAGADQFSEAFVRRHQREAVELGGARVGDLVLGTGPQREGAARPDRRSLVVCLGMPSPLSTKKHSSAVAWVLGGVTPRG